MSVKKTTQIFIVAIFVVIFVYDFYAWVAGGTESTVSWQIFEFSYKTPAFTFGMGFIMGHLFWQMKGQKKIAESKDRDNGAN